MPPSDPTPRVRARNPAGQGARADDSDDLVQALVEQRERQLRDHPDAPFPPDQHPASATGDAYLARLTPYLVCAAILGLMAGCGTLTENAHHGLSFFGKLWEATKNFALAFGGVAVYGVWRCRKQ